MELLQQFFPPVREEIGAGAGNPPAVVDETADIRKAAQDIVNG